MSWDLCCALASLQVDYELAPGSLRSAKEIFPASLVRERRCGSLVADLHVAAGWQHWAAFCGTSWPRGAFFAGTQQRSAGGAWLK